MPQRKQLKSFSAPEHLSPAAATTNFYDFRLITPMIGGGYQAGELDLHYPLRETGVKSALRFWWRVLMMTEVFGTVPDNPSTLRSREFALFGEPADESGEANNSDRRVASRVSLHCELTDKKIGPLIEWHCQKNEKRGKAEAKRNYPFFSKTYKPAAGLEYALFPFNERNPPVAHTKQIGQTIGQDVDVLLPDTQFRLGVTFNYAGLDDHDAQQLQQELDATLRCFSLLGGLGARTRRGFGAIEPVSSQRQLQGSLLRETAKGLFTTKNLQIRELATGNSAADALNTGLLDYKNFRQSRPNRGRSDWPEPDSIRHLTGKYLKSKPGAKAHTHSPATGKNVFPRHEFGLPIVFQFKDSADKLKGTHRAASYTQFDPDQTELLPDDSAGSNNRHASPLILRPVREGNRYVCLAIVLPQCWRRELDGGLLLKDREKTIYKPDPGSSGSTISIRSPQGKIDPRVSVLDQFIDLCTHGWTHWDT